jgi:mRNA interferase RelE/StbE
MTYRVIIASSARREIDKLTTDIRQRIIARILSLEQEPRPIGVIKKQGEDAYRIRVGDYRVIYSIEDAVKIVTVIKVGHRRDVYR